jgi:hypothetical protein
LRRGLMKCVPSHRGNWSYGSWDRIQPGYSVVDYFQKKKYLAIVIPTNVHRKYICVCLPWRRHLGEREQWVVRSNPTGWSFFAHLCASWKRMLLIFWTENYCFKVNIVNTFSNSHDTDPVTELQVQNLFSKRCEWSRLSLFSSVRWSTFFNSHLGVSILLRVWYRPQGVKTLCLPLRYSKELSAFTTMGVEIHPEVLP